MEAVSSLLLNERLRTGGRREKAAFSGQVSLEMCVSTCVCKLLWQYFLCAAYYNHKSKNLLSILREMYSAVKNYY